MNYYLKTLILITLVHFSGRLTAQDDEQAKDNKYPQTVLIKVIERTLGGETQIITVDPDNNITNKTLEWVNYSKNSRELENNLVKLRTELQIWQNKGFHVQSTSAATVADYIMITTIILSKD